MEAGAGHGEFAGERRLTDAQIATIRRGATSGPLDGSGVSRPPTPARASPAMALGEALTSVRPNGSVTRSVRTGDDMYRNFVLPIPVNDTRYIKASAVPPGQHPRRPPRHDAVRRELELPPAREQDPEPGYEGLVPRGCKGRTAISSIGVPGTRRRRAEGLPGHCVQART